MNEWNQIVKNRSYNSKLKQLIHKITQSRDNINFVYITVNKNSLRIWYYCNLTDKKAAHSYALPLNKAAEQWSEIVCDILDNIPEGWHALDANGELIRIGRIQ